MTERDKRIEEMVGIAYPVYGANYMDIIAMGRLADAGYRKEEEVKKKTAMEIANWLDNNVYRIKEFREFLKIKFGVEVEE